MLAGLNALSLGGFLKLNFDGLKMQKQNLLMNKAQITD